MTCEHFLLARAPRLSWRLSEEEEESRVKSRQTDEAGHRSPCLLGIILFSFEVARRRITRLPAWILRRNVPILTRQYSRLESNGKSRGSGFSEFQTSAVQRRAVGADPKSGLASMIRTECITEEHAHNIGARNYVRLHHPRCVFLGKRDSYPNVEGTVPQRRRAQSLLTESAPFHLQQDRQRITKPKVA